MIRLEDRYDTVMEMCELPGLARGHEQIKLRGVERFRARAAAAQRVLTREGGLAEIIRSA